NGFDGRRQRAHPAARKAEFFDWRAAGRDARLTVNDAAVVEAGDEVHIREGGGENAAANGEHFAGDANGFGEIAGDVSERGEKKIPEIVADKAAPGMEAVLEQAPEQRFVFGERDHAVANVPGRQDAVFAPQAAGAAAIVRDGTDGGEIGDRALATGEFIGR